MSNRSRSELHRIAALWAGGLRIEEYNRGGQTAYTFYPAETPESSSHSIGFALGLKEAWFVLEGIQGGYLLESERQYCREVYCKHCQGEVNEPHHPKCNIGYQESDRCKVKCNEYTHKQGHWRAQ